MSEYNVGDIVIWSKRSSGTWYRGRIKRITPECYICDNVVSGNYGIVTVHDSEREFRVHQTEAYTWDSFTSTILNVFSREINVLCEFAPTDKVTARDTILEELLGRLEIARNESEG